MVSTSFHRLFETKVMHRIESESNKAKDKIRDQWVCNTQKYEPLSPMKTAEDKEIRYPKGDKVRFTNRPHTKRFDLRSIFRNLPSWRRKSCEESRLD